MERNYTYDAFISYRHMEFDKAVADKLQKLLEKYVPPASIVPRSERKKLRLFRDETELASSSNLSDEIKRALESSRFLIVICSKATKDSHWCQQEIEYFKELHNGSVGNILTLLIEGEPSEVFPRELRFETYTYEDDDGNLTTRTKEVEPLATNISAPTVKKALKRLNQEYLRLVAPLLRCRFDDLYNRNQRRRNRKNMIVATVLIVILSLFGIYNSFMRVQIDTQRVEAQKNYEEAEVQRLLALTNLEDAEFQRALAQTSLEEAESQRKIAMDNLEEVKFLLLSNAIDYAERLNEQGARARAGAVLKRVYEHIDSNHEDAEFLYARFRDVAIDTLYYDDMTLPFVRQKLSGEIKQIRIVSKHEFAMVRTRSYLYKIDLNNGNILERYPAPDEGYFIAMNTHGVHVMAITGAGDIVVMNTETKAEPISTPFFCVDDEHEAVIYYNEDISALIIVSIVTGSVEDEFFSQATLSIIPSDLHEFQVCMDEIQTFIFWGDIRNEAVGSMGIPCGFRISENGRFIAVKFQFAIFQTTEGTSLTGLYGEATNSYIYVVDINQFDRARTAVENVYEIEKIIDVRKNDEELFLIGEYFISNQGVLVVDGWSWEEQGEVKMIPRTIAYNALSGELMFNEQLDREYIQPLDGQGKAFSWSVGEERVQLWESSLLPFYNQYNFELLLHLIQLENIQELYDTLGVENAFFAFDKNAPTYLEDLESRDGRWGDYGDEEFIWQMFNNDSRILSLSRREEGNFLQVYYLPTSELSYWEHMLPENFNITHGFLFEDFGGFLVLEGLLYDIMEGEYLIPGVATVILVGEVERNSRIIVLREGGFEGVINEDMQTLDIVATTGALDIYSGRMIIGHLDGTLLMYNFDNTDFPSRMETNVRRVGRGYVLEGYTNTGIALQRMNENGSIIPLSYNVGRTLAFGIEGWSRMDAYRTYNIWCLETGEIVHFDLCFAFRGNQQGEKRHIMLMNSSFSHVGIDTREGLSRAIYIIEVDSGDIVHEYYINEESGQVFWGIGDVPNLIWLFHVETLLLEVVDISERRVVSQRYISERIRGRDGGYIPFSGYGEARYRHVYFNIEKDIVIFKGNVSMIYSFISGRTIFSSSPHAGGMGAAPILEVNSDLSAVYLVSSLLRIDLVPEVLFDALNQSPFIGKMTEEDIRLTRLDIFD